MNKKKIFYCTATIVFAAAFALGLSQNLSSQASTADVTLANVEAFNNTQSLECAYKNITSECSIYIGAKGKITLLGGTILKANADGYVTFDGQVICEADGKQTCTPVSCKDLYETILKK